MKRLAMLMPLLFAFLAVVTAPEVQGASKKAKNEVVMKVGNKIHLFHSSKVAAQKEIAVGDVLDVYRLIGRVPHQEKKVGQVKVTGFMGEHYFTAEVVQGQIKIGDVAKKSDSALLVQPPE